MTVRTSFISGLRCVLLSLSSPAAGFKRMPSCRHRGGGGGGGDDNAGRDEEGKGHPSPLFLLRRRFQQPTVCRAISPQERISPNMKNSLAFLVNGFPSKSNRYMYSKLAVTPPRTHFLLLNSIPSASSFLLPRGVSVPMRERRGEG